MKMSQMVKAVEEYLRDGGDEPKIDEEFIKEHTHLFLKLLTALTLKCKKVCDKTKAHHYGITLTRNPNKDSVEAFIKKANKMLQRKWFDQAELMWAFEAYDKEGQQINEHIHVYAKSDVPLHFNDLKKSYPNNRIDMQRLQGDKIPRTKNYIQKDTLCEKTIEHYKINGLSKHYFV